MELFKALDFEELYRQVKDYDLVITADPSLADGINSRLEQPRLGRFVITPRRLVRKKLDHVADRATLFSRIIQSTDLSWKTAHYLLTTVLSCWKETGDPESILSFPQYSLSGIERVLDIVTSTDNYYSARGQVELDGDQNIAVVGPYQLQPLDWKIIPPEADSFSLFDHNTKTQLPKIRLYQSSTDLGSEILESVKNLPPSDIAVVVNPSSKLHPITKSKLESADLPTITKHALTDKQEVREFLSLVQSSLEFPGVRMKSVQRLQVFQNMDLPSSEQKARVAAAESPAAERIRKKLTEFRSVTFQQAVQEFEELTGDELPELREQLQRVKLSEEQVSRQSLDRLQFFLNAYGNSERPDQSGVLFASPQQSVYIDRPVVYYLGLNESWNNGSPQYPWQHKRQVQERADRDFSILLQNGNVRFYMAQEKLSGERRFPSSHFNRVSDVQINDFTDLPHCKITERVQVEQSGNGFHKLSVNSTPEPIMTVGQSQLNLFLQSPKQYLFSQLIDTPDNYYTVRGNIHHDFAQFYREYPHFAQDQNWERLGNIALEKLKPYIPEERLPMERTQLITGMEAITQYLDSVELTNESLDGFDSAETDNLFAEIFDRPLQGTDAELWFSNYGLGITGKIDLLPNNRHVVDYKTGRSTSLYRAVRRSNIDLMNDDPDVQPIMYLTHLRNYYPNKVLQFTYFYPLEDYEKRVQEPPGISDMTKTITYFPASFREQLCSQTAFDFLSSAKVRWTLLEPLGYENYCSVMDELNITDRQAYRKPQLLDKYLGPLEEKCEEKLDVGRGEDVTCTQLNKGCKSVLKKIQAFRTRHFFKEDLDRFEKFVDKQLDKINRYSTDGFPAGDIDLDNLQQDYRDLILR